MLFRSQLEREGVIKHDSRKGSRGPAAEGWRIVFDEDSEEDGVGGGGDKGKSENE